MTTYTLTINTDELGLGVIDGGKVVVTRKRATAADQYPPVSALYEITTATNGSGVATAAIKADDSSTYHACRVWDADGALVYQESFAMPPEASDLHNLSEAVIGASNIQFKDDGTNRGTPSTTRNVDFTGSSVSATFSGETLTVNVDASSAIATAVSGHSAATDPHGDRAYADSLVTGLWDDRGNFDASGNAYPSSGGSGTAGAVKKGDIWTVSVAGTLPTAQAVEAGDTVRALADTPGQTQANWAIAQNNIGYVDSRVDRDFEDFRNLGETASHFAANMRARVSAMTITTPSSSMTLADISGAAGTSGWMRCYTGALGAGAIGYITEYFGYSPIAASASKEFVWAGSLDTLPTDTTTTDAVVRIGFGGYAANIQTNPVAQALASAYFQVDKGGYWKCFSGKTGATENTTTGIATAAMTYVSLRIIVAATTGVVSFYINGTLVATHSGVGACPYEQQWYKFVSVYNQGAGTIATSSTSGPGAVFFDAWGSAIKLASDRANLRFLT